MASNTMAGILQELDSLEILVIVDNELDPITSSHNAAVQQTGGMREVAMRSKLQPGARGGAAAELRMDAICCGAHGLSLMITAVKAEEKHTILFDTGPEEWIWERNVSRLRAPIENIERIHLSHWHPDHSGGMARTVGLINEAKAATNQNSTSKLIVDLHPNRPDYRGIMGMVPISLEADPTFEEIEKAGAVVEKHDKMHTILDDMFLISGEIPRVTAYEKGIPRGIRFSKQTGKWEDDTLILDERLVACRLKDKGLVVFTGCSHAGVVNASRHAMQLGGGAPLYCVIGGYHLADAEKDQINETVEDLKKLKPKILMPGHCTGWRAKYAIEEKMEGTLVPSFVGVKFVL